MSDYKAGLTVVMIRYFNSTICRMFV